jgi:hypothetical protein
MWYHHGGANCAINDRIMMPRLVNLVFVLRGLTVACGKILLETFLGYGGLDSISKGNERKESWCL